jgi:hypothetical protein
MNLPWQTISFLQTFDPSHHRSVNLHSGSVKGHYIEWGHMRPLQKLSSRFEYLENRSHGLDVTWQPVRGDLCAHPWTVTLTWGYSLGSEVPLTELMYCVTVTFTYLHPFNGDFSFEKSQKPRGAKSGLWGGLTALGDLMFCQTSLHKNCRMDRLIVWSACLVIVNAMVTQYTSSVNSVSLPTD